MAFESNPNESTVDSAKKDIQGAVKMGKDAAKTAKTVTKVAAQAASGNVVGAAVELVKDPETLKKLLIIALIPIISFTLIVTLFLYALPTAIYEAAVSYCAEVGETWEESYLSNEGGTGFISGFFATLDAGGKIVSDAVNTVGDALSGLWNGIKGFFTNHKGEEIEQTGETISDDGKEVHVAQQEAVELDILVDKLQAAQKKLKTRGDQIAQSITDQKKAIAKWFKDKYSGTCDVWEGVSLTVTNKVPEIKENTVEDSAVWLANACAVSHGGSLENMKLSDFLKWLGYYRSSAPKTVTFPIGGSTETGITASVKTWKGTFMPQYLVEEVEQRIDNRIRDEIPSGTSSSDRKDMEATIRSEVEDEYVKYQGPAVDMMFVVNCPDFSSIEPIYWDVEVTDYDLVTGEAIGSHTETHARVDLTITVDTRDVNSIINAIGFMGSVSGGVGVSGGVMDMGAEENYKFAYQFLTTKMGLNRAAAAGVIANMNAESAGLKPDVNEHGSGIGYGICQWSFNRRENLMAWCSQNSLNPAALDSQLAFFQHELETSYKGVYDKLKTIPNTAQGAYDAAYYVCCHYEIPKNTEAAAKRRGESAQNEFFSNLAAYDITTAG